MGLLGNLFRGPRAALHSTLSTPPQRFVYTFTPSRQTTSPCALDWLPDIERMVGHRLLAEFDKGGFLLVGPFLPKTNDAVMGIHRVIQKAAPGYPTSGSWSVALKPGGEMLIDFDSGTILVAVVLLGGTLAHHQFRGLVDLGARSCLIVSDRVTARERVTDLSTAWSARLAQAITAEEYAEVKRTLVPSAATLGWESATRPSWLGPPLPSLSDFRKEVDWLVSKGGLTEDEAARLGRVLSRP